MNAAKYAQKLKHIRKVKAAIKFQEAAWTRLEPLKKQRKDTKEYTSRKSAYIASSRGDLKNARKNAREDWVLGPLRPNRAIGRDAERYGAVLREQARGPDLPQHWYGAGLSLQNRMKTRIPKHVLHDQWPIVVDDRVVVIRGREKNKVGVVSEILKDSNELTIKDLNKVYIDGRLFNAPAGEKPPGKREHEHTISYNDVRLIVPQFVPSDIDPNQMVRRDVIVEDIDMERHTVGKNPLTQEDTLGRIPDEEAVDPETGDALWHRYIAGTRTPIEWPWDESDQKILDKRYSNKGTNEENDVKVESTVPSSSQPRGILENIRTLGGRLGKKTEENAQVNFKPELDTPIPFDPRPIIHGKHQEFIPPTHDDDTSANTMNDDRGLHDEEWIPTLLEQPLPPKILEEIKGLKLESDKETSKKEMTDEERLKQRETKKAQLERKEQRKQEILSTMKTPMQLKRDMEQAKKQKYDAANSTLPSDETLEALGNYLAKNLNKAPMDVRQVRKDVLREDTIVA